MIYALRCSFIGRSCCCLLTAMILLAAASAADKDGNGSSVTAGARLNRSFTIRAGREVTFKGPGLRIKFAAVAEDSRCPSDVTCVWAGNAAVRLEVSTKGEDRKSLTLNTSSRESASGETVYHGYKFRLVNLNPYPRSTRKISAKDYVATLLVSKE